VPKLFLCKILSNFEVVLSLNSLITCFTTLISLSLRVPNSRLVSTHHPTHVFNLDWYPPKRARLVPTTHPTQVFTLNWYPPEDELGGELLLCCVGVVTVLVFATHLVVISQLAACNTATLGKCFVHVFGALIQICRNNHKINLFYLFSD